MSVVNLGVYVGRRTRAIGDPQVYHKTVRVKVNYSKRADHRQGQGQQRNRFEQ